MRKERSCDRDFFLIIFSNPSQKDFFFWYFFLFEFSWSFLKIVISRWFICSREEEKITKLWRWSHSLTKFFLSKDYCEGKMLFQEKKNWNKNLWLISRKRLERLLRKIWICYFLGSESWPMKAWLKIQKISILFISCFQERPRRFEFPNWTKKCWLVISERNRGNYITSGKLSQSQGYLKKTEKEFYEEKILTKSISDKSVKTTKESTWREWFTRKGQWKEKRWWEKKFSKIRRKIFESFFFRWETASRTTLQKLQLKKINMRNFPKILKIKEEMLSKERWEKLD